MDELQFLFISYANKVSRRVEHAIDIDFHYILCIVYFCILCIKTMEREMYHFFFFFDRNSSEDWISLRTNIIYHPFVRRFCCEGEVEVKPIVFRKTSFSSYSYFG